jgi:ATP-dependent protease ClpP protease subunit
MGRNEIRAQGENLVIDLFGEIGGIWFFGGVTAESFADVLREHPSATTIRLAIKSNGGSFTDAIAMRGLLARHPASVEVEVMGMAASAASLVAIAGDTVSMTPGSFMMIHEARRAALDPLTASQLEKAAAALRMVNAEMVTLYAAKSGQTEARIIDDLAAETFLSAAAAVEYGLADNISGNAVALAAADIQGLALPAAIRAQLSAGRRDMDLTQIATALGCAPTEEAIRAAIAAGQDATVALKRVTAELDTTKAALLTMEVASSKAECDAIVAQLQTGGYMAGTHTVDAVNAYAKRGDAAGLRAFANVLGETRPVVPTGGRQSSPDGAPRAGELASPPMKDGAIDFGAIGAKLPAKEQAKYGQHGWELALSTPHATFLWELAGYQRPDGDA